MDILSQKNLLLLNFRHVQKRLWPGHVGLYVGIFGTKQEFDKGY